MNMDTITLHLKSVTDKMKNNLKDAINTWQQYDNTTNKVANSFNKVANANKNVDTGFTNSKAKAQQVKKELDLLIHTYNKHVDAYKQWGQLASTNNESLGNTRGMSAEEINKHFGESISKESIQAELDKINELKQTYKDLVNQIETPVKKPELVPKTENAEKNLKNVSNKANDADKNVKKLSNSMKSMGGISASIGSKGFDILKHKFNGFSKDLGRNIKKNTLGLRKLALGLIGVRTVMSMLTKSVNAYLSFDSELQDSLTNSWNMLGALLAPAIELVANLFAMATNYVAQFVNALTGIDLVARANAKALNTQAKANEKANKAQRGLLSMDEITNLPTESGGAGGANQIATIDTKPIKWLEELLVALKKYKWHRAGEIIAESISKGLKKIDWDTIRQKAEETGTNIADFMNGVFEVEWGTVGASFANGLNTLVDFVYGFVNKIEWGRVGAGIATSINNFFNTFDFGKLAETINKTLLGVLDAVTAFIVNLDEEKIAKGIKEFVKTIKWLEIGEKIIKLLIEGLKSAVKINNILWDGLIEDVRKELNPKIEKLGENIGGDLGDNISGALKTALESGMSTIERLFNPIGSRFKDIKSIVNGTASFFGSAPPLATGTNEIEYEGLYHLHEGEAVVPKRYNPSVGGYDSGADNKQIIDLLVELNSNMLELANRPTELNINGRRFAEATYDDIQQIGRNRNQSTTMVRS